MDDFYVVWWKRKFTHVHVECFDLTAEIHRTFRIYDDSHRLITAGRVDSSQ